MTTASDVELPLFGDDPSVLRELGSSGAVTPWAIESYTEAYVEQVCKSQQARLFLNQTLLCLDEIYTGYSYSSH
jgi:hypothetical protein